MIDSPKKNERPWTKRTLETRLRALPQPAARAELERAILDAIPSADLAAAERNRSRPLRWALVGTVAAAAAVLIVALLPSRPINHNPGQGASLAGLSKMDIQRTIERRAIAAMHLASADLLDSVAGGDAYAAQARKHVAATYAEFNLGYTPIATQRSRP